MTGVWCVCRSARTLAVDGVPHRVIELADGVASLVLRQCLDQAKSEITIAQLSAFIGTFVHPTGCNDSPALTLAQTIESVVGSGSFPARNFSSGQSSPTFQTI